jgi:predicted SAM-dependent methyltransferase
LSSTLRNFLLFLFSHRFLAIARWDLHFIRVRVWNAITSQRGRIRNSLSKRQTPLFLNLGSGPRGLDDAHWVNIDGYQDQNVHYLVDFGRPLPFPKESFDGVFCEHVMEHFSLQDGERLAREVYRTLRLGGCFRIVVPDAELLLRRYFDAPDEMVERRGAAGETPMEVVNLYFRQRYEHQFLYDWATMEKMLLRAGFERVCRSAFGQGLHCQPIVLDDGKYDWESLYVEALKSQISLGSDSQRSHSTLASRSVSGLFESPPHH